jgi:hypothetical protein
LLGLCLGVEEGDIFGVETVDLDSMVVLLIIVLECLQIRYCDKCRRNGPGKWLSPLNIGSMCVTAY